MKYTIEQNVGNNLHITTTTGKARRKLILKKSFPEICLGLKVSVSVKVCVCVCLCMYVCVCVLISKCEL